MQRTELKSWLEIDAKSDFSLHNMPFGIFETSKRKARAGVAIGEFIIDLSAVAEEGLFNSLTFDERVLVDRTLNGFIALGKQVTRPVRQRLIELFSADNAELRDNAELKERILVPMKDAKMLMPVRIPNYTDFYSSREHATNVGAMFRDPKNALLPNWLHLPVGYHGRASSIVVSGTEIHRPKGQTKADDAPMPSFGPSRLLDFELEMGFVIGKETALGSSVTTANAEEHIFGLVVFNDWSARDIQKWEYVPLGPFLAKNFASTLSPWIVTIEALEPFRVASPKLDPEVLPYLQFSGDKNYDIALEVDLIPENGNPQTISKSNFQFMYWNMCQQLAHHTVNGCNIQVGDLYASGTISGKTPDSYGSMLELTWQGKNPIKLSDGSERKFIQDNDTIVMRGHCEKNGVRVGFGECRGKILPAL